jgi:pseudouridine kinase
MADDIPVFVDTVSEFKAEKIRPGLRDSHPQKPTLKELADPLGPAYSNDAIAYGRSIACINKGNSHFCVLEDESVFCSEKEANALLTPPDHTVVDSLAPMTALWRAYCIAIWKVATFVKARALPWPAQRFRAPASVSTTQLSADNALYLLQTA